MCCCDVCQEWERRKQVEAARAQRVNDGVEQWGGFDSRLAPTVGEYLIALMARRDYELANYRTLADHLFIAISVTEQGIVVREPPLAGTALHHDWRLFQSKTQEGEVFYARQCRNCGITYFKVTGDPASDDNWVKGGPFGGIWK